ncbi:hypothetical protein [Rhizobium binae]|nr:hypothetical protein [Rhizobium binae]
MVYDWSGAKVRRVRIFKAGAAFVLGTAMAAIPLLWWAMQLRDF